MWGPHRILLNHSLEYYSTTLFLHPFFLSVNIAVLFLVRSEDCSTCSLFTPLKPTDQILPLILTGCSKEQNIGAVFSHAPLNKLSIYHVLIFWVNNGKDTECHLVPNTQGGTLKEMCNQTDLIFFGGHSMRQWQQW
jgi:hypothetical protein